jgi:hypothetical protein
VPVQGASFATRVVAVDLNGDGVLDLVTSGSSGIGVSQGNGDGTFQFGLYEWTDEVNPTSLTTGDYNGDGRPDVAVSNGGTNSISIFLGTATNVVRAPVTYPAGRAPVSIVTADFNGDGTPDLVTANSLDNGVSVLLYSGCGKALP